MSQKSPNSIDKHVGHRVRVRRILVGMSQERLGELLGLSFQQIQKYEKGLNRISASRLHEVAELLGVDITFFFDGNETATKRKEPGLETIDTFLAERDGFELAKAFVAIPDDGMRRAILDIARVAANLNGEAAKR